ncbi:MAG: peptidoglycan endopeptidase [Treponema sp.]|nr:peptidoglycan endopeptidase [Treponema sp.]
MARKYWLPLVLALIAVRAGGADDKDHIAAFSDPARVWGRGVESVIEEAYREGFKTAIIGGRVMNLRMPFAENNERSELTDQGWEILGGGKADPRYLWEAIGKIFKTEDFLNYTRTIMDGREKVIVFDIPTKTWSASFDLFDIARMKAGAYRGLPHRPYVLVSGSGIQESDVYNYLYCVGWIGMDCSGFVWHVLSYIARKGGVDLGRSLRRSIGNPRDRDPSWYVGTKFFNSSSRELITVKDEIRNIRPADVLLFRGEDGSMVHSAIIQSVNFSTGVIRYLQSTDEAPLSERGIHESFITFDPGNPGISLADPLVSWNQARYPPFPGEKASPFSSDGERYRAYAEKGGGKVVRLRIMAEIINKLGK